MFYCSICCVTSSENGRQSNHDTSQCLFRISQCSCIFFFYCTIWFPVFTFIKSGCQRTTFILFIYILLGISKMAILLNGYPPEAIQSTRCVWYMNEEDILINYRVRNQQYWYACLCQPCSPFNDEDIYF